MRCMLLSAPTWRREPSMGSAWPELLTCKESAMACVQGVCIVVLGTCGRGMWVGRLDAQCLECMECVEWVECVECMVYGWMEDRAWIEAG